MKRAEQELGNILKERQLTIAFAESMTCGLVSHKLGSIHGASDFLVGSVICYNEDVKNCLLNISKNVIKKYTAESQHVTDLMAKNLAAVMSAQVHAAITGLATKGGSETKSKPVGTVFFSVFYKKKIHRKKVLYRGMPLGIKQKACEGLFKFIVNVIER